MTETKLWKDGAFVTDDWTRIDAEETPAAGSTTIIPLEVWNRLAPSDRAGFGVVLAAGEQVEDLGDDILSIPLIALEFPAYTDGRAYSKAQILREHHKYTGEIRAVGDVLPDQVPLMLRVGFNALEVSHPVAIERLEQGLPFEVKAHMQVATAIETEKAAGGFSWRRVAG